jgi:surface antigen
MNRRLTLALLAGTGLLLPIAGQAQLNPFRSSWRAGLSNEDFRLMNQAAEQLRNKTNVPDGTSTEWSNTRSGASGTITIDSTFHSRGMLCRKMDYSATRPDGRAPATATLNWCKTPQGWKILS